MFENKKERAGCLFGIRYRKSIWCWIKLNVWNSTTYCRVLLSEERKTRRKYGRFGVLLRVFRSLGLGLQVCVMTPGFELPWAPNSVLTKNRLTPTNWPHGSFLLRHLTLVPSVREKGWYIRRTNEEIYESYQKPQMDSIIKARRLQWQGHMERVIEVRTVRRIAWKTLGYKKKRGRPRKGWRGCAGGPKG